MLLCKALLASQVGFQAVELEFHLTGDVDHVLGRIACHAQRDIHNCSVVLLFFFNESENGFFSTQRAMHVNVSV